MANDPAAYESYEGFLKAAIKRYLDSGKAPKTDLIALLLATREAWEVAWDETKARADPATLLKGAAGVATVTFLLRSVLGGPLGVILAGASVASLVTLYSKHRERIGAQVGRYRELVEQYRSPYDEVLADFAEARLREDQRDLMVDGLLSRLVADLEALPNIDGAEE